MQHKRSACPLDCPDTCSLTIEVDDDGRAVGIEGSELNPLTEGLICGKVRRFARHVYGDERLTTPLVRDGARGSGAFRPVEWDRALDLVAERLRRVREGAGGEAILPYAYGGSNGKLTDSSVDERLWRRLGTSRLLRTYCAEPTGTAAAGLYGRMPGVALEDYVHARLIILWGCNPSATGIHLVTRVREAQARGARVVVIDPRAIPLARQADLHIAPRVGADLPLALALIDWLFANDRVDREFIAAHTRGAEELAARASEWPIARAADVADVPASAIETLASWYADTSPAVIRIGWGQERNRNGGSSSAALFALPAIAGKMGVRGGGFTSSNSRALGVNTEAAINQPERDTRAINMTQLGRALTEARDPRIELLFVYNCNPVATAPEQNRVIAGLEREDLFTVVYDQVMTDTAAYADVILPATTFLEHRDLRLGYGSMTLFDAPAVIAPVGQARPNYQVFAELIDRLGLARDDDPESTDALVAAVAGSAPDGDRIARELADRGMATPPTATPVQMVDVHPRTASGLIELCPAELDAEAGGLYRFKPDPATDAYPLALISPALAKLISSSFGQLLTAPAELELCPADAAARGIAHGDAVRVYNDRGEVLCRAAVTGTLRPGVVSLPKGLWRRHTANRLTSNALCPDTESDLGRGACYNDARVQVEPA